MAEFWDPNEAYYGDTAFNQAKAKVRGGISRVAGSARGAVDSATSAARNSFNSIRQYLPSPAQTKVLGGAAALLGAGFEAKERLDRGEDTQRAATGAAANLGGTAAGAAIGQALIPIPVLGAVVGGIAGGAIAGWGADRVTDAVRGNDGKGTDAVIKDMTDQIQKAQANGNFARAAQLAEQVKQFAAQRQAQGTPGTSGANNYEVAKQYGVQQSDAGVFGDLRSQYNMNKWVNEDKFNLSLSQDGRRFEQEFAQTNRAQDNAQRRGQIERLRNQVRDQQNEAARVQQEMINKAADRVGAISADFSRGLAQSFQGGGIR